MRKRLRILLLACLAAAIVVPVGFALSLESAKRASAPDRTQPMARVVSRPVAMAESASTVALTGVPEWARLVGVGSVLFGLAAVMRRTRRTDA
ncbi:MAG: hypothetical protein U0Q55_05860 [Vicinamibacterales bacterium]